MEIKLDEKRYGKEFFFEKFLREVASLETQDKLEIDLSDSNWLNDFQLSTLGFVLCQLRETTQPNIYVTYSCEDLFTTDPTFDFYSACGFFRFLKELNVKVVLSRESTTFSVLADPLIQFQVFENLGCRNQNSQVFLYQLTSNLQIIKDILKEDVFGKTDVAERLAKLVTKELIENINLHSCAKASLVRVKYIKSYDEIKKKYGQLEGFKDYFNDHSHTGFFVLNVSDNGVGIAKSLKEKYLAEEFLSDTVGHKKELASHPTSWWLEKAFSVHKVAAETKRSRIGLNDILEVVKDYRGLLFVRSHDAGLYYATDMQGNIRKEHLECAPFFAGTHYAVILPAKERKKVLLQEVELSRLKVESKKISRYNYNVQSFDINYDETPSPISTRPDSSESFINTIVSSLSKKFEEIVEKNDTLLEVDFSNAVNQRVRDYIHILSSLWDKYGEKFTSRAFLRNISSYILDIILRCDLVTRLEASHSVLLAFSDVDKVNFIGVKTTGVVKELSSLFKNQLLPINTLSYPTSLFIRSGGFMVSRQYANVGEGKAGEYAVVAPFEDIFEKQLKECIENEFASSNALVDGHFLINDKYHADKYLVAHLMFQSPALCRMYAKSIAIELKGGVPDILVSYSTTGIILYWYLKNYHYSDLQVQIIKAPNEIVHAYGQQVQAGQKVVVVTDVNMTGTLINKIADYVDESTNGKADILRKIAIFDVSGGNIPKHEDVHVLYFCDRVKTYVDTDCTCSQKKLNISSVSAPEVMSALPTVYHWQNSLSAKRETKRRILNKIKEVEARSEESPSTEERDRKKEKCKEREFLSYLDDQQLTGITLAMHWRIMKHAFQVGHVERNHTHFYHYDIPEKLIFKKLTHVQIEGYVKRFVWSFNEYIDYVVYNKDLTAAYLAHLIACKFLRKPKVVESRRFPNDSLVIPESVAADMRGKKVLVVDDACNTGMTLKETIGLVHLYGGMVQGVFTLTSRNTAENEMLLRLLVPKVATAYRLNLEVFSKGNCPVCKTVEVLERLHKESATQTSRKYFLDRIKKIKIQHYVRE